MADNDGGLLEGENNETKIYSDVKEIIRKDKNKEKLKNYNSNDKNNYYFDNGELLSRYYDKKNNNDNIKNESEENTLICFMKKKESVQNKDNDIINEYLYNTDDTKVKNYIIENIDICNQCGKILTLMHIESYLLCEDCGYTEKIIINSDKTSYKDPPRETSYFAYKRINHFNEWLAQFQAKESNDITDYIYNQILKELNKDKVFDIKKISYKQIRDILKKLKLNKYYENIPHIINIINGEKAPELNRQQEEQLRIMFKEIQQPFMKNCPEDRKNFLSYSYVLHKFCQLIELDDFLIYFPLLKSREKLQQQDRIWNKICNDLKWQFIPSI